MWAKGPTEAPAEILELRTRHESRITAPESISESSIRQNGPTTAPEAMLVTPSRMLKARIRAPAAIRTAGPIKIVSGRSIETPAETNSFARRV